METEGPVPIASLRLETVLASDLVTEHSANLSTTRKRKYGARHYETHRVSFAAGSPLILPRFGLGSIAGLFLLLLGFAPQAALGQTAPTNDAFASPTVITGLVATVIASNVAATKQGSEPNHAGDPGGASLWWRWTAPTNASVTLDTLGSGFDTLLAVYVGDIINFLSNPAANDDINTTNQGSRVTFSASTGTSYRIAVDGYGGARGSIVLDLRVGPVAPQITNQPKSQIVAAGAPVSLTVGAGGDQPLIYQWFKDQALISLATNATLAIASAQTNDSGIYTVTVSNLIGGIVSSNASLSVGAVVITAQPGDLTIAAGYGAIFTVAASGTHPVLYQWLKDGAPLPGATNATYSITGVRAEDTGAYSVIVTNDLGFLISSNAILTVITPYTFGTFAGLAGSSGTNDGIGSSARFYYPHGIAVDSSGNVYVADVGNEAVRRITSAGAVSTMARLRGPQINYSPYSGPWGVATDSAGSVYVADTGNNTIAKITPDGTVTTLAGSPGSSGTADGTNSVARFNLPSGIAVDSTTNIYIADYQSHLIRKIKPVGPDWVTTTLAGVKGFAAAGFTDGKGTHARFNLPSGVGLDSAGNLFVADQFNNAVRKITTNGIVTTLAGAGFGQMGYTDGAGSAARFNGPHGGRADSAGNVYVADYNNAIVRRVTPAGLVTTLAGMPLTIGSVDATGNAARFGYVRGVAVDGAGNLYVADYDNHTIRKGVPFALTAWPQSQGVPAGTSVSLTAIGSGEGGSYSYQWSFGGTALVGQTGTTLDIGPVWRTNSGLYSVLVSNVAGYWINLNATVRALVPPTIQTPQLVSNAWLRLQFRDADGGLPYDLSQVQVQWRTNLPSGADTNWLSFGSQFYLTNGFVVFEDTNAVLASRFYRILEK